MVSFDRKLACFFILYFQWEKLLADKGLGKYVVAFANEELTEPEFWHTLTDEDFKKLGMKIGAIKKFAAHFQRTQVKILK